MINSIIDEINKLNKPVVLVAIDGRCGAGKSTVAARLKEELGCNVFHMDDYYLRPGQRTAERLATPGENVDYERFLEEILQPIYEGKPEIIYKPFDCKTFTLGPEERAELKKVNIIEGTYSLHESLRDYFDLKIFLDVEPEEQIRRIRERNTAESAEMFEKKWIPLEEMYFEKCHIRDVADIILKN